MKFDGKKLKQIRLEKGYTQIELSNLSKEYGYFVDSRTLSTWESSSQANPRPKNVEAVANALGVKTDELYIHDNTPSIPTMTTKKKEAPILPSDIASTINFLESVGYVCILQEEEIILRANGRTGDLPLSFDELSELFSALKSYSDFLLYQKRNQAGKA